MKYSTPELETDRLILHRGTYEDFVRVYEYDFRRLRDIHGDFAMVKQDPSALEGYETYADEEDVMDWILYKKEDGTPIGNVTADRISKELNAIELAYNLHPDYWGREYMKEAVVGVMRHLFSLGFDNILCGYSEGNRKSKRVIEKLGFQPYSVQENAWVKDGKPVTDYTCILSRQAFRTLYGEEPSAE